MTAFEGQLFFCMHSNDFLQETSAAAVEITFYLLYFFVTFALLQPLSGSRLHSIWTPFDLVEVLSYDIVLQQIIIGRNIDHSGVH